MRHLAVLLIRTYQICVSPCLPRCCIYTPSCSHYALEAYRRLGFWRGSKVAAVRLLRCGPWSAGGQDPVR